VIGRHPLVLIKGAGDLATGCALRLRRSGFRVVMTELPEPRAVRRTVAFCEAVLDGSAEVEGLRARRAGDPGEARRIIRDGEVAVLVDPAGGLARALRPDVVVDARMAKRNLGTSREEAPIVIGLGPGFRASDDAHAVIETNRGHFLGSVILEGEAEPNTGVPGDIGGHGSERLLRSPAEGRLRARRAIGDSVAVGDVVAEVSGHVVRAGVAGILRGLTRDGSKVGRAQKIGDVDPRARREHCFTVSDKARAVAGGVLEAILHLSATAKPSPISRRLPMTTRPRRGRASSRSRRAIS
jgi:xanthine dehydrogenase accessory factor